jgi:uncharacterized protein HemY
VKETLAVLLFQSGRPGRGVRLCKDWIEMDPTSPLPHYALGVYYFDQRMYTRARRLLARAVKFDPHYWQARLDLARTHLKLNNDAAAVAHLRLVAERAGGRPEGREAREILSRLPRRSPRSSRRNAQD